MSVSLKTKVKLQYLPDDCSNPWQENGKYDTSCYDESVKQEDMLKTWIDFFHKGREKLNPEHVRYKRVNRNQLKK